MQTCLNNKAVSLARLARIASVASVAWGIVALLAGCNMPGQGQWKQGPAISLPAVAAEVSPLQLVINNQGDQVIYSLICASTGKYGETTISATTSPNSKETVVSTVHAGECLGLKSEIVAGTLVLLSNFKTDDQVTISLDVQPMGTLVGVAKLKSSHLYEMGTDGRLRAGAGSVWWQP